MDEFGPEKVGFAYSLNFNTLNVNYLTSLHSKFYVY